MNEKRFRAWTGEKMRPCSVSIDGKAVMDFGPSSAPLMQSTGLKDRRGCEIYEGDIFVSVENNEVYTVGSMTPLDRHLDMLADNIGYFEDAKRKKYVRRSPCGAYHLDDWVSWPEMYEVIGNIHKNPELLH